MNKIEMENNKQNEFYIKLYAKKIRESDFSEELVKQHSEFINSQIEIANNFYKNLGKEKEFEKIASLTNLSINQAKRLFS